MTKKSIFHTLSDNYHKNAPVWTVTTRHYGVDVVFHIKHTNADVVDGCVGDANVDDEMKRLSTAFAGCELHLNAGDFYRATYKNGQRSYDYSAPHRRGQTPSSIKVGEYNDLPRLVIYDAVTQQPIDWMTTDIINWV